MVSLPRKNYAAGLEMHCPGGACSNLGPQSQSCLCLQNRRQGSSAPVIIRGLGGRDGIGVGCLCAGEGPIVRGDPSRGARTADRHRCSARSDMMLELPHLLQASQAEIPIQFVDEIPHDLIPLVQCPGHYAGFVSGRLRGFRKMVSSRREGGDPARTSRSEQNQSLIGKWVGRVGNSSSTRRCCKFLNHIQGAECPDGSLD
ncbi:hypothetical protein SAMN05216337_101744 [Bradyrhizobium brasilense]|uniref:Uncharacterized protein n=1 Tax=Bradyrhizobium brasilense TaxID=1419277 RepID=A0A1G6YR12_9BRAD|nr:hypothetical protein SAMN05216337_101744 [Bradyrhizobium brasilense]